MAFNAPTEIALPDLKWGYVLTTKWNGVLEMPTNHGHHTHHAHSRRAVAGDGPVDDDDLYLGDVKLQVGSPFREIYAGVIKAY